MIRMFQVKSPDALQSLIKAGAKGDAKGDVQTEASSAAALARLQQLNPHVNLSKLKAGTVLLVPDIPGLGGVQGASIGAEAFDGLAADAASGLKAATAKVRAGAASRDAERKELTAIFKSAEVKRLSDGDAVLQKELVDAELRFKADQKEAAQSVLLLDEAGKALTSELAALGKLFK
jgi:hypothetical protein